MRSDQRWPTTRDPPRRLPPRLPVGQQVVEHRVQPLLRRVPRLQEVVVERDVVDRVDRDVGVGVGRHSRVLAGRVVARLLQQLDAGHRGHALVGGDQRDGTVRDSELGEDGQAPRSPTSPGYLVVGAVLEVAGDRLRHRGSSSTVRIAGLTTGTPSPTAGGEVATTAMTHASSAACRRRPSFTSAWNPSTS